MVKNLIFCANNVQTFGLKTPKIDKKTAKQKSNTNKKSLENQGFLM